jgi:sugar phosphate isomerase/epimerase
MLVALHSAPTDFFKTGPPYKTEELLDLVDKAAHLGFMCLQIGPTSSFIEIDGSRLRIALDKYGMNCNVHVGGIYHAEKFVVSEQERNRAQKDLHCGIELSKEVCSSLVSFHPPFFESGSSEIAVSSRAKMFFRRIVKKEVNFAHSLGIRLALESFCYSPFTFNGLDDFMQFVSGFPQDKLGILLEVGHLYQAGFNLEEAIQTFGDRLLDVHVHDATQDKDFKKGTHLPIGKGSIRFPSVINSLRRVRYDGWLTLEIHGSQNEILESKRLLEKLIEI